MTGCRAAALALSIAALLGAGGCSRAVDGTAVAAPGEVGAARGSALLATTCGQYVALTDGDRREVIDAIGADGNQLVAMNPDVWAGVAAALCTFADPGAPVRDVLTGGMR